MRSQRPRKATGTGRVAELAARHTLRSLVAAGLATLLLVPTLPHAQTTTSYVLPGLSKPVEILRDKWGVSHIYAKTVEDLFFAQGFNAARDRLWQLDLWRRQGEGKLAEAFGPRFVEKDRAARLFLFRGDMEKEFRSYHPEGKRILTAFAKGINAYVDLTQERPELLPLEFQLTGTRPGSWRPESSLIRLFGLTRNVGREVTLARLVNLMGADAVEPLSLFEPPATLEVPPGLDLSLIDGRILETYNLGRGGVTFRPEDLPRSPLAMAERTRLAELLSVPASQETDNPLQAMFASNNWAISGALTATGTPILSGDPHRAQSVPSLRYMAHLVGPGWNVIGAGEPAIPGISMGHNERIAFALTIFAFADEEDLYVYDTNPTNPSRYLYKSKWEDMRIIEETIDVRGEPSARVHLKFTRHGPVLFEDLDNRKAYALRAAYLEHPGTAPYLASLRLDQARNWRDFVRGMERHYTPSENMVYADIDGNIGWMGGSIAPIRPNWNGLLPVPGNGAYEWKGFLKTSRLPRIFTPPEGFMATANQYNVPDGYRYTDVSAHEWADPYRYDRIVEVLGSGRRFTLADSMRLQYDQVSLPARKLVPLLRGLSASDPDVNAALQALREWDYVLAKDSVPAAIYEVWVLRLHPNVFNLYVPAAARSLFGSGNRRVLTRLLSSPDSAFGADPVAGRDVILMTSLEEAVAQLKALLGPDMANWTWGALHHMKYEHDLSALMAPATRARLDVGPLPIGGDGFTVHNTGYRTSDFRQTGGASYRQVLDLGDWDNSVALNSPGQSGDPGSPHYRNLFPLWAEGEFFPLLFSREKIEAVTEEILLLHPTD
jgi:penicillin amidase